MLLDSASLYFRAFFGVPDQRTSPDETTDQRAARLPRHDRHPGHGPPADAPRRLLGRRLAAAVAGRPGAHVQDAPADRGVRRGRGEPRRPHPAGADHPRRAARHRHPPARGAGLRGRRRHRHAHRAAPRRDAGRRRHRRPRPAPARRRRRTASGCSTPARAGCATPTSRPRRTSTSGMPCPPARPTSTCRCCAATPATGCPGVKGIGDKTAAQLIATYGVARRAARRGRRWRPGAQGRAARQPRGGIRLPRRRPHRGAGAARRRRWPHVDLALPREVADPELLEQLGEAYGVTNPVGRVLKALGLG